MVSSPELQASPWSLPVERPSPSVASSWPVPHGPSQGNILCLVKHQAIPTAVLACRSDYMSAQALAHLRGVATTPAPAFRQPRGTLPPGTQGLPLAAEAWGTCARTAPLLGAQKHSTLRWDSQLGTQVPKVAHSWAGRNTPEGQPTGLWASLYCV